MELTLQLTPRAALAMQRHDVADADVQVLLHVAKEIGAALRPMHPGVADPSLQVFYLADVPDTQQSQREVTRLRACAAIAAAYVKPDDAPP